MHFFSKVDKMNNDVVQQCFSNLKEVISSNVCVMIMVLLYMVVC